MSVNYRFRTHICKCRSRFGTEETDRNSRELYRINAEATKAESDYRKLQVKLDVLDKYYTLVLTLGMNNR